MGIQYLVNIRISCGDLGVYLWSIHPIPPKMWWKFFVNQIGLACNLLGSEVE